MNKLYTLIVWHNNTAPALNEDNLNAMSEALDAIDSRVVEIAGDVIEVVPQIQDYLAQAQALEEALELLSRNPPYIGANGNWYVFNTETSQYEDSGVDASITVSIADITMIAVDAQPYITNTGTNTDPVFHLFLPRSPQGETGNGIDRIEKTSTSGLVDTYTIYYTNGTTTTYTVTNGQSGSGSGDMNESDYDPNGAVKAAGGIIAYLVANYQGKLTFDVTPTQGSSNPVTSGGIFSALGLKINTTDIVNNLTETTPGKVLDATQGKALNDKHKVTSKQVDTSGWATDTTSQSGTTLYKKTISLNHVYVDSPSVDIGAASGSVLPTAAQQTAYDLLQYVTVDGTTMYLYGSDIPTDAYYINVEGVD